jgi:UDP-N-acetylglucosamine acyltransferase
VRSVNTVGLERRGFDADSIRQIREAFKILYKRGLSLQEAQEQIAALAADSPVLEVMLKSITGSLKGIHR